MTSDEAKPAPRHGALPGNTNALLHGAFTREAREERRKLREARHAARVHQMVGAD